MAQNENPPIEEVGPRVDDTPRYEEAPPEAKKGETVLRVTAGSDEFHPGGDLPAITRAGVAVKNGQVKDLIQLAADNDVTIEKLEN